MNESEKELVEMVLSGHTEIFEKLIFPYRKSLLNMAYRFTKDEDSMREKGFKSTEPFLEIF